MKSDFRHCGIVVRRLLKELMREIRPARLGKSRDGFDLCIACDSDFSKPLLNSVCDGRVFRLSPVASYVSYVIKWEVSLNSSSLRLPVVESSPA